MLLELEGVVRECYWNQSVCRLCEYFVQHYCRFFCKWLRNGVQLLPMALEQWGQKYGFGVVGQKYVAGIELNVVVCIGLK